MVMMMMMKRVIVFQQNSASQRDESNRCSEKPNPVNYKVYGIVQQLDYMRSESKPAVQFSVTQLLK